MQRAGRPLQQPAKGFGHLQRADTRNPRDLAEEFVARVGRLQRGCTASKDKPSAETFRPHSYACQELHCQGWLPRALPLHRCQVPCSLRRPGAAAIVAIVALPGSLPPVEQTAQRAALGGLCLLNRVRRPAKAAAKKLCHCQVLGFATYLQRKGGTCKKKRALQLRLTDTSSTTYWRPAQLLKSS